jgi:selenocysteine-specific translation elongation factor
MNKIAELRVNAFFEVKNKGTVISGMVESGEPQKGEYIRANASKFVKLFL